MAGQVRPPVLVSYAAFVLVGISGGVMGVLLPSQMAGYGVDRGVIGTIFLAGAAGFALAGFSTGALIHRFGVRVTLTVGGLAFTVSALYLATRPPFAVFVAAQIVTGYGIGILESGLNVYLSALPGATTLLNRLHAFWGVGALLGPPVAAWIVGFSSWTVVWLVQAAIGVPLIACFLVTFRPPEPASAAPAAAAPVTGQGGMLGAALRDPGVRLGAAMLAVYVGLELGVGNWGFSYLVQARALPGSLASYAVSGYWLGLTLGRFLISPVATRLGVTPGRMLYGCLAGVIAAAALAWLSPSVGLACVALGLLGFFIGPIFPTTMASVPRLTSPRLVPTAIGVMNAASVIGGSVLPWLIGTIAQSEGMRVLLPYAVVLGLAQLAVWRPIARRICTPES
jgi:fucose permease